MSEHNLAQRAKDAAGRANTAVSVLTAMLLVLEVITWRQFWTIFAVSFGVGLLELIVTTWWRSR